MSMLKKIILCTLKLFFCIGIAQAKSEEVLLVENRYGFDESSEYETILEVLSNAYADFKADPSDKQAFAVTILAPQYLTGSNQMRLLVDFNLYQNESHVRRVALKKIAEFLASGGELEADLATRLCNRLCLNFADLTEKNKTERDIINYSSEILLSLGDQRGITAMLANDQYIKNVMRSDRWDMESTASVFLELAQQYKKKAQANQSDRRKAVFYKILHKRKSSGKPLVPSDVNLGLSKFFE